MATYYVRKSGNDGWAGTSPSTAWLTIDNAANNVAAADVVYIGSGVYREAVTMDTAGTSGNEISFIGDITGAYTGDPGLVIVTAHDSETAAPARASCLDANGKEFIIWENVLFLGGTDGALYDGNAGNVAYEGNIWRRCGFWTSTSADRSAMLNLNIGAAPGTVGFRFYDCVFCGSVAIVSDPNESAHIDVDGLFQNCLFTNAPNSANPLLVLHGGSAGTYNVGGIDVINCTFWGSGEYCVYGTYLRNTVVPHRVLNCLIAGAATAGIMEGLSSNNTIYEDYNLYWCNDINVSGDVQSGGNSDGTIAPPLLGGLADTAYLGLMGWSPFNPWEPVALPGGAYSSPLVGFASATYAPATDIYGNARPMGRNTDDVGAVEANPQGIPETGTVRSGANSLGFLQGAGYVDKLVQVDAASTTVEVYGRYDANYTGSNPILRVLNIPGVADQSDAMTGGAGAWEKLECTFTPTSAGFVRVRMESRDTSANGECYFDDLRVK